MKIVCVGDLEGRSIWKDIIANENPDITVFLGDYVASRVPEITPADEIYNLNELLNYKEEHQDNIFLLRGNHDNEACGYPWARCWPAADYKVAQWMKENLNRFLSNTQWIYQIPGTNIICSHAGIGEYFLNECKKYVESDGATQSVLNLINTIEPNDLFGFTGDRFDNYGYSKTQPCTWIRPVTLSECAIKGYTQVVGHTRVNKPYRNTTFNGEYFWLCDSLYYNNYLVIDNGEFKPKHLEYEIKSNK